MKYQSVRSRLLTGLATISVVAIWNGPLSAGTIQDGSWGGSSYYQKLVYDNSARDMGDNYNSVGMMNVDIGNYTLHNGTGTLIGSRWVLTAAHVVDGWSDMSFTINGKKYKAARWFIHKGYDGDATGGRDIALVKLESPVKGIKPSKVAPRTKAYDLLGETITTVGYGGFGTGLTGYNAASEENRFFNWSIDAATERAGSNTIDSYYGQADYNLTYGAKNVRVFTTDFDPEQIWRDNGTINHHWIDTADELLYGPGTTDVAITHEWSIASGDSGGPSFNEAGQIVGITSFVNNPAYWKDDNDVWHVAMGFYNDLSLDDGDYKVYPDDDADDYDYYYSEDCYTNAALYANWIKNVKRLANTPGMGQKLRNIAQVGSMTKGAIYAGFGNLSLSSLGNLPVELDNSEAILNFISQIPEPGSVLLLSTGTLLLLRRRRA